jgi:transposase
MTSQFSKDKMELKQVEAQELFEKRGMQQKDIALQVGVSEKTISDWVTKFKWIKVNDMSVKRKQAMQLLKQNLQQKEVAKMLGVSEKTMCQWVKKERSKQNNEAKTKEEILNFVEGFKNFVAIHFKRNAGTVHHMLMTYMNTLE